MSMFRSKPDRIIDDAHNAIACAEMSLMHAFTDEDKATYGAELSEAQRYLARAVKAKAEWYATDHGDYDVYPDVPRTDQESFL